MYVENGIAYAGECKRPLSVVGVRALADHRLWVRFSSGETRFFDFKPFLKMPAFAPLADEKVFSSVGIDYGVPVWDDGNIDMDPETLFLDGTPT